MSIHLVDVHQATHTCPADPEPHVIDTRRTVMHVIPGGPCRTPVTIRLAGTSTTIPCGRHEPDHRQCGACRTIVTEHAITTRHLGYHGPEHHTPAQVAA